MKKCQHDIVSLLVLDSHTDPGYFRNGGLGGWEETINGNKG